MSAPNPVTGLLAGLGVICVWSGFIVFSRAGVTSGLTAYDLVALRFMVAGTLTLPFAIAWWPRHLPWRAQAVLAIAGPGALYSAMMFSGLTWTSAAYGGVFSNGSLPLFAVLLVLAMGGSLPGRAELTAIAIIVAGGVALGWSGMTAGGENVAAGIALFLASSALITVYVHGIGHWKVTPRQALAVVNIPNMVVFLPLWWFLAPSTMADADLSVLLPQAAFQGIGPGFLALILFAMTAYHLGTTATAAVSAVVPATAAVLAIPVLDEIPNALEWAGVVGVSFGLGLLAWSRARKAR